MAYAVLRCGSRASTRHASDGFPLIFFFLLVAKRALLSSFLLVRQDQLPTTHTRERAGSPGACHQVVYLHAKRALFPCFLPSAKTWKGQPSCPC